DPHAVAGGDDVALLRRQRLEQAAHGTAELPAVVGLNYAEQSVDAQHPAEQASAAIDRRHLRALLAARVRTDRLLLDDGALARQVALGADALLVEGGILGEAVLLEAARPALLARRFGAVLAQ